jgi:hypothetical protein
MDPQITCPHCRQALTFDGPVPSSSKVKCPACQRLFVRAKPAANGAVQVATPYAPPPGVADGNGYQEPVPASPHRPRSREAGVEPAPRRSNAGVAGLVVVLAGVFLVLGLVLGLCLFAYLVGEPTPEGNQLAQLPDVAPEPKQVDPPVSVEENLGAPEKTQESQQETVKVTKPAEPPPVIVDAPRPTLTPVVQKQIDLAIDRGVLYLRSTQHPSGRWFGQINYPIGYAALPALTLLECGVSKEDPSIQRAAQFVRANAKDITKTYELSLAILFLDKLQNPKDKQYIQAFAARLVAGQNYFGGWSYECPIVTSDTRKELITFLQRERQWKLKNLIGKGELSNPLQLTEADLEKRPLTATEGASLMPLQSVNPRGAVFQERGKVAPDRSPEEKAADRGQGTLPGLPGAAATVPGKNQPEAGLPPSKKEMPDPGKTPGPGKEKEVLVKTKEQPKNSKSPAVPSSLRLLPIFNPSPGRAGFPQHHQLGDNSNTQFALLGLWVARRYDIPLDRSFALAELRFRQMQNPDDGWGYGIIMDNKVRTILHQDLGSKKTMTCVGLLGLAIGKGSEYELLHLDKSLQGTTVQKLTKQDEGIQRGLKKLATAVRHPTGQTSGLPMEDLYLLWSVERMAVLYNLKTLGDKDWYLWGAEILLSNQQFNGCWAEGKYHKNHPVTDTCFALLFLKRANLAPDLSDNLRLYIPVVDPDRRDGPGGN